MKYTSVGLADHTLSTPSRRPMSKSSSTSSKARSVIAIPDAMSTHPPRNPRRSYLTDARRLQISSCPDIANLRTPCNGLLGHNLRAGSRTPHSNRASFSLQYVFVSLRYSRSCARSAPRSIRAATTPGFPLLNAARCRAVQPLDVSTPASSPSSISARITPESLASSAAV